MYKYCVLKKYIFFYVKICLCMYKIEIFHACNMFNIFLYDNYKYF